VRQPWRIRRIVRAVVVFPCAVVRDAFLHSPPLRIRGGWEGLRSHS
jgi:hypothetical protein